MNFWTTVYAIGAMQAVLLAPALWRRPVNAMANRVLAVWLALVGIDLAVRAAFLSSPSPQTFRACLLVSKFPLLHASLFYLYTRTLTMALPITWRDAIWLTGFFVALLLGASALLADEAHVQALMQSWLARELQPPLSWYGAFLYAWSLACVAAALLRVVRYRRQVREHRSDADRMSLHWLLVVALGQVAIWFIAVLHDTIRIPGFNDFLTYGAVAAWVCVLGYFGLVQAQVSPEPVAAVQAIERPLADDPRLPEVQTRLEQLMRDHALYLEPVLTIAQLAKRSGYPEYLVSATINRRYGCTFWEYINRQRVASARRLLADPGENRTILDIAYACGFTSKSTFNAAFKRATGDTPSAYRGRFSISVVTSQQ